MATTEKQFLIELYEEHLEEASFLREQRIAGQQDPEQTWISIGKYEARLEAHIDALVVGNTLALTVCQARELEGDAGELYAIISVYSRTNSLQALFHTLGRLDYEDVEQVSAVRDALIDHASTSWVERLSGVRLDTNPAALPVFIPFLGYFTQPLTEVHTALIAENVAGDTGMLQYLGAMDMMVLYEAVTPLLFSDEGTVRELALTFLLYQRQSQIVEYTLQHLHRDLLPLSTLTLATDVSMLAFLSNTAFDSNIEEAIRAMGYIGVRECIPVLLRFLGGDYSTVAAQALFVITGAPLFQELFEAEVMTEEDLFPEELAAFREGILPTRVDGKAFGRNVQALTEDRDHWMQWLKQHEAHFQAQKRYRLGGAMHPLSLCRVLASPYATYHMRQHTYHELVVRYQCPVAFTVNDWVHKQQRSLSNIEHWAQSVQSQYSEGDWYLYGEHIPSTEIATS